MRGLPCPRALVIACSVLATLAAVPCTTRAEDSDILRWYLHLKFRDTDNLTQTGFHDYFGFGLGVNLNRYVGIELSGDRYELFPKVRGLRPFGEYGVFALMPQLRLRYPLFNNRLVPYAIGGAGIALTDFNDRKSDHSRPETIGMPVKDEGSTPVATVGGGLEFFVADNVAFDIEYKYLFAANQTLTVAGVPHAFNASTSLYSVGVRLFYPELRPAPLVGARDVPELRLYLGFRLGVAVPTDTSLTSDLEARPVPGAIGGVLDKFFGVAFGLDMGRYAGVELTAEGFEMVVAQKGLGSLGEYAFYAVIPHFRLRYPLADGRLVPYAIGGVGLGYAEFNDRKVRAVNLDIQAATASWALAVGGGVEWFVTRNIAVNVESRYLYSPGHPFSVGSRTADATIQAISATLGLRIYLAEFRY
jgi:opacity protein-like surface antigen